MENASAINLKERDLLNLKLAGKLYPHKKTSDVTPLQDKLWIEGGEGFISYMEKRGYTEETDLLVLSSKHHFYYDEKDMEGLKVLVNVKKLNYIKHLDSFLHVIFRVLPSDARFIGCFVDSKTGRRNGSPFYQTKMFYRKFIDFLDSRTNRSLNRNDVEEILDSHGFRVVDMTDIDGLTYFTTLNQRNSGE
jgi:hypothetical protein